MRLEAFRIQGFKSIIDTGWCSLSEDNITVVIGQNEAGKSAVLEALQCFQEDSIDKSYIRADRKMPEVCCSFESSQDELNALCEEINIPETVKKKIKADKYQIKLLHQWKNEDEEESTYWGPEDDGIITLLEDANPTEHADEEDTSEIIQYASPTEFADTVWDKCPDFVLFDEASGDLPDNIDTSDLDGNVKGVKAANNFLQIADLDIDAFQSNHDRRVKKQILEANNKITGDFQQFWHQKIGGSTKIGLQCELKHHSASSGGPPGTPYLSFWITEGTDSLHPHQRSRGVRWFLSFYLQLTATMLKPDYDAIYFLDEPGGSLHIKAQRDVLSVIDRVSSGNLHVLYTTHSPDLIDHDNLHRILAVQRADGDDDSSSTIVLSGHELGCANTDTLSPLYAAMGADFSNQDAISKDRNVILEEPSAFYYFQAFWKLLGKDNMPHFLPATGANKVPIFANLLTGWGLSFIAILDDDTAGRRAYTEIKKNLYGNEDIADKHLLKNRPFKGVEDMFSTKDFAKFVLGDDSITISNQISQYVGTQGLSKPMLAIGFLQGVKDKKNTIESFDSTTQANIKNLVSTVETMLSSL